MPNARQKNAGIDVPFTRANFHSEGGIEAYPKVFKVKMGPDLLATDDLTTSPHAQVACGSRPNFHAGSP
jgi:hypothetical protein